MFDNNEKKVSSIVSNRAVASIVASNLEEINKQFEVIKETKFRRVAMMLNGENISKDKLIDFMVLNTAGVLKDNYANKYYHVVLIKAVSDNEEDYNVKLGIEPVEEFDKEYEIKRQVEVLDYYIGAKVTSKIASRLGEFIDNKKNVNGIDISSLPIGFTENETLLLTALIKKVNDEVSNNIIINCEGATRVEKIINYLFRQL